MPLQRLAPAALVALSALLLAAPAANAGPDRDSGCGYTGSPVFAPWGDNRDYTLIPDGGFENATSGWTLDGGAAVTEGNESFQVGGAADHQSLALPAGGSATSPSICVERHARVLRMFARTDGGRHARLRVEVLYADGQVEEARELRAGDEWAPTRLVRVTLADGATSAVSLRFTPVGAPAAWQVDDIYVDPRLRH